MSNYLGNNGMWSYILSRNQLAEFFRKLWIDLPFPTNYTNSAACVTDAFMMPMSIPILSNVAGSKIEVGSKTIEITGKIGNLYSNFYTDYVSFQLTRSQINSVLNNNFSDYSTLSKYLLYLPFFGYSEIENDVVLYCDSIKIDYKVNFFNGNCLVIVSAIYAGNSVRIMELDKDIGYRYTISGTDQGILFRNIVNSIATTISVSGVLLGQPATVTTGATLSNITKNKEIHDVSKKRNKDTGRLNTMKSRNMTDTSSETADYTSSRKVYYNKSYAVGDIIQGLNNYSNSQKSVTVQTNHQSNNPCFESIYIPYLYVIHPKVDYFNGFNKLFGRPLNSYKKLNTLRGYTKVSAIHLNIPCLSEELGEIEDLLYSGVILNTKVPIPDVPPVTPTPEPETPATPEPEEPTPTPDLPEGETAKMLCCFNGKFRVTGIRGTPAETGRTRNHYGLDLVGMDSTNVYAISSGWVKITDTGSSGLGKCVHIQMDDPQYYGQWILYGHLSSFAVANKQYVNKGQLIGVMGNTGDSTGPHTHLEWRNKYDKWDSDFSKYNICEFTGIPNISTPGQNVFIGSPIYKTTNGESVQKKLGLENKTIQYLENYTYAEDLMRKIDEHTK